MPIKKLWVSTGLVIGLALTAVQAAQAGSCRDPWVTQAITEVTGRQPNGNYESGECNIYNFNGGSWNNYTELKRYVRGYFARNTYPTAPVSTVASPSLAPRVAPSSNVALQSSLRNGKLIGDGGGTLIGDGGGTLIGHDGATATTRNNN